MFECIYVVYMYNLYKDMPNRKILILGDMLELGDYSDAEHINLGAFINKLNIDIIITYGSISKLILKKINNDKTLKKHFKDIKKLKDYFNNYIIKGDNIYIKGSRSMKLERIFKS